MSNLYSTTDLAAITAAFDFEEIFPTAIKAVFAARGMNCFIPQDTADFQKTRPRVDAIFVTGSEAVPRRIMPNMPNQNQNATWAATLTLEVVTNADVAGKAIHAQYRSICRWLAPFLPDLLNPQLTNHVLKFVRETGAPTGYNSQEGYWTTHFTFSVDFAVKYNALGALPNI